MAGSGSRPAPEVFMTKLSSALLPPIALLRATGHRPLQCMASYHRSEDQARSALARLRAAHGLTQMQTGLARPADAGSLKLRWQSRRWLGQWPFDAGATALTLGLTAGFGGLSGLVLWAFWWTLEHLLAESSLGAGSLWCWLATLLGAGFCGALAVAGSGRQRPHAAVEPLRPPRAPTTRQRQLGHRRARRCAALPGGCAGADAARLRRLERRRTGGPPPLTAPVGATRALQRRGRTMVGGAGGRQAAGPWA